MRLSQRTIWLPAITLLLLSGLLATGCGEGEPELAESPPEESGPAIPEFTPPTFESGRVLDTLLQLNLDSDTDPELLMTSLDTSASYPFDVRADRLEIYDLNRESRSWERAVVDTALWYDSYKRLDLSGDEIEELVATTWAGGNDEIAGRGMAVYSGENDSLRRIFARSGGSPEIVEHEGDRLLLVSSLFWPDYLPHSSAVPVPEELISLEGGEERADYETARSYFRAEAVLLRSTIDSLLNAYLGGRGAGEETLPSPEEQASLYALLIETIETLNIAGDTALFNSLRDEVEPKLEGILGEEEAMIIGDELYGP